MCLPTSPANYFTNARSYANSRRAQPQFGTNWGWTIFVVDDFNDTDDRFSNGDFAYAYPNGPFMVMTYGNSLNYGISRMNLVTAHETGHIFGALDEYAASQCSTADTWG